MKRLFNRINGKELREKIQKDTTPRTTFSFYRYALIQSPHEFRDFLYIHLSELNVLGRIYVAKEGVNGQVSIPTAYMNEIRSFFESIPFMQNLRLNIAVEDDHTSFFKLAIKVREKIVADGLQDDTFDVTNRGEHLDAPGFNALTADDETIIVDMRNHYESEVGHFENAICPDVETFREALPTVVEMLKDKKDRPVVMYCTGGIRCEKASAYLKHQGFKEVYQLDGGIIEYAHQVEELGLENKFKGKNFVFDERLGERISDEIISKCHQCGKPSDLHTNCANDSCHILFIQCEECASKLNSCCSEKCMDFIALPEDVRKELRKTMEFNGSKFGKGRYKANHRVRSKIAVDDAK